MMIWPSQGPIFSASNARAMPAVPPAGKGTMNWIGLVGKVCAWATKPKGMAIADNCRRTVRWTKEFFMGVFLTVG